MGFTSMKASSGGGGDFELAPAGNHPAVLVGIIDLGTQEQRYGNEIERAHKVMLVWELTTEKKSDGGNFIVARDYTLSFNSKANLRLMVEKWRGAQFKDDEGFDISKLLGKPCLLSVVHGKSNSGKDFAKVDGATAVPKGMSVPSATKPTICWEMGNPLDEVPPWVPFYYGKEVKKVIAASEEFKNGPPQNGAPAEQKEDALAF